MDGRTAHPHLFLIIKEILWKYKADFSFLFHFLLLFTFLYITAIFIFIFSFIFIDFLRHRRYNVDTQKQKVFSPLFFVFTLFRDLLTGNAGRPLFFITQPKREVRLDFPFRLSAFFFLQSCSFAHCLS